MLYHNRDRYAERIAALESSLRGVRLLANDNVSRLDRMETSVGAAHAKINRQSRKRGHAGAKFTFDMPESHE